MRANAWILAATLAVSCAAACCKKNNFQNQQGSLAVDDGTTDVTGKADDFGSPCPGSSAAKSLSLVNTSLGDVAVSSVSITGSDFTANVPALPFTVPAGGSVALPMTFAPTAQGPAAGTLTVRSDAENDPISVNLTGTGQSGGPEPVYSATCTYQKNGAPFTQSYPCSTLLWSVNVMSYVDDSLQLSDQGCPALVLQSAVLTGNDAGVFTLPNLPSLPVNVEPGTPLTVNVRYSPLVANTFDQATLTLTTNDPVNGSGATPAIFVYNLTGTGLAPEVQLTPAPWDFGAVQEGQMVSQLFTLQNDGTLPVTLDAPTLQSGAPFSISNAWPSGTVLSPIGAGDGGPSSAQCAVDFTSPGNGLFQDQLMVGYSSAEGTGTATANVIAHSSGALCPSPNPVLLPANAYCGAASASVRIGNCGNADLHVTALAFNGAGNPEGTFSVTLPTGTTLPADVPADGGLTVMVTYTDNGNLTDPVGTLQVSSDDPSAPDGGTAVTVEAQATPVPKPGDSPAQQTGSAVGVGVTTVFVAEPGNDAPLYSYVWSIIPATNVTLVSDGGEVYVTPSAAGKYNVCLQEYEQPVDGGATCGFDSGVPGSCTPFNP